MKTCLSCEHSDPYAPKCCRSTVRYRCRQFGHDVGPEMVPGETFSCDRFKLPDLPFGYRIGPVDGDLPDHLL